MAGKHRDAKLDSIYPFEHRGTNFCSQTYIGLVRAGGYPSNIIYADTKFWQALPKLGIGINPSDIRKRDGDYQPKRNVLK